MGLVHWLEKVIKSPDSLKFPAPASLPGSSHPHVHKKAALPPRIATTFQAGRKKGKEAGQRFMSPECVPFRTGSNHFAL